MKKVKFFLWLIILFFLGLLVYQNLPYFLTIQALTIDLKIKSWNWVLPEMQNIVYWAICFVFGLIVSGIMGISSKIRNRKMIKSLNKTIDSHAAQISSLRTELEVFINDPYIKKQAENAKALIEAESEIKSKSDSTQ
jgi:uncharacterized membrane protein YciS (DUF1049 family)